MLTHDPDRRRIRLLWVGGALYFLILLNGLRYLSRVPLKIVILPIAINVAMIIAFIVAIKKVNKKIRNQGPGTILNPPSVALDSPKPQSAQALWLGASAYFVAMVIAIQYVSKIPYQIAVLGGILNMAIIFTFVFKLRKAYLKPRGQSGA